MEFITALGLLAGTLTTMSLLPQLFKIRRTKSAGDISTGMFVVFCVGVVLWLIYGMINRDIAIITSNFITLVLSLTILILKAKYARQ